MAALSIPDFDSRNSFSVPQSGGGDRLAKLLEELAYVVASIAGATRCAITRYDKRAEVVDVVVHTLGRRHRYPVSRASIIVSEDAPVRLLEGEEFKQVFSNHPIRNLAPQVRSMAVYWISENGDERWTLSIGNPSPNFNNDDHAQSQVERIVHFMAKLVADGDMIDVEPRQPAVNGFHENATIGPEPDIAMRLLLDTLVEKPILRNRGKVAYIASRTWRKDIKEYQIRALANVKDNAPQSAAVHIARELAEVVRRTFGNKFDNVVPVPCGSSGREACLSVEIGRELARLLGCKFVCCLVTLGAKPGSSHPSKSASLKPYKLTETPTGNVLLVDDVASSGRHLELAYQALSASGANVNTAVWIAG